MYQMSCLYHKMHDFSLSIRTIRASMLRGFAKKNIPKIRVYFGSWWVGPGLTRIFLNNQKNNSKPVLIFGVVHHGYYTLLKVVSRAYYDLSVLSMSAI